MRYSSGFGMKGPPIRALRTRFVTRNTARQPPFGGYPWDDGWDGRPFGYRYCVIRSYRKLEGAAFIAMGTCRRTEGSSRSYSGIRLRDLS